MYFVVGLQRKGGVILLHVVLPVLLRVVHALQVLECAHVVEVLLALRICRAV